MYLDLLRLDDLKKGSVITEEMIEKITGVSSGNHKKFDIAKLNLKERLIERIKVLTGEDVSIRECQGQLRILTDEEAREYNNRHYWNHIAGAFRKHKKMLGIDTRKLSPEQLSLYNKNIIHQAFVLHGISERVETISAKVEPVADHRIQMKVEVRSLI